MTKREKDKKELRYASAKERAEKHEKGFEPTALRLPEGAKLFRFKKKGVYKLDIMPYEAGPGNPFCDEGFLHYERTYYSHLIPTPDGSFRRYCCLVRTFNRKRCPVCEYASKLRREGKLDSKDIDGMDAKERQLFNVIDRDEPKLGVQVFEFNWFQFGKQLDAKVEQKPERYETFYHLQGGRTIEVKVEEESFMGRAVLKPANFEFESRDDYDESWLERVYCLDKIPREYPYDELKAILEGQVREEDTTSEKKPSETTTRTPPPEEEDEDEEDEEDEDKEDNGTYAKGDLVEYNGKECEVTKVEKDGRVVVEDEGGKTYKVLPTKLKRIKGPGAKSPPPDEEDEDEDEDEEDEQPRVKGKPGKK